MTYNIPYSFIPGTKARAQEVNENFEYTLEALEEIKNIKLNKSFSNITKSAVDFIKNCSYSRYIGEILLSIFPMSDSSLHLLDGSLLEYENYKQFIDYIEQLYNSSPEAGYFCSENEWQELISDNGVCGKFVYNGTNKTVRLPKLSNKIYTGDMRTEFPVIGNGVAIGLTDGTNNFGMIGSAAGANGWAVLAVSDSRYNKEVSTTPAPSSERLGSMGLTTNPAASGLITQLSGITHPCEVYYHIVVSNSINITIPVDNTDAPVNTDITDWDDIA